MLKGGRSLERTVSLRSGARVEDALERLGHEVIPIDVGADLVDRLRGAAARRRVRRAARPRRRGRHRAGAARAARRPVHGSGPVGLHPLLGQGPRQARAARRRAADARLLRVQPGRVRGARRGRALPAIEERLGFPIVVKPAAQGSALGIKFARTAADVPGALVAAFSYDTKVLLERHVAGPRPRGLGARRPTGRRRSRSSRRSRTRRTSTTSRRATRSAARRSSARPTSRRRRPRGRRSSRSRRTRARLLRLRARRPDARRRHGRAVRARGQRDPRADRDVAAPAGRRGRRDRVRRPDRPDRCEPAPLAGAAPA